MMVMFDVFKRLIIGQKWALIDFNSIVSHPLIYS